MADTEGAGRGVVYLDSGSMVFKSAVCMDVREALRCRRACSTGTIKVLTAWPGRYGQAVVEGKAGSCVSTEPSSSYWKPIVRTNEWMNE